MRVCPHAYQIVGYDFDDLYNIAKGSRQHYFRHILVVPFCVPPALHNIKREQRCISLPKKAVVTQSCVWVRERAEQSRE